MSRSSDYSTLEDTPARKRKWYRNNPDKVLAERQRAALRLLERTGCIVAGIVVNDPRKL